MQDNKQIPLVVAFTSNYFIPAATCLFSVLKNSRIEDKFHVICLLKEYLPFDFRQHLQLLMTGRGTLTFLNMGGKLDHIDVNEKYTEAAYYRLLLPDILVEYDKILYIDCDMIIRQNLADLYRETVLQDDYLAGVAEATLVSQHVHLDSLGLAYGRYINSGFLLMNLRKMREDNIVPQFIRLLKANTFEFPDQDVLNVVCKDHIKYLSPWYNGIRTFFIPKYKHDFLDYYSAADLKKVLDEGNIHYTGGKPWDRFTVAFNVWWSYYVQLPDIIKKTYPMKRKLYFFYLFYKTRLGNWIVEEIRTMYRVIKN